MAEMEKSRGMDLCWGVKLCWFSFCETVLRGSLGVGLRIGLLELGWA